MKGTPSRRTTKSRTLQGTRERILDLLRRSALTANEIAASLEMTHNAIRPHLTALGRDGLVRGGGMQRGGSRPAVIYELAPGVEATFSHAYIPFVAHLLRALGGRMSPRELDGLMHEVGRGLAAEWPRSRGDLRQRVNAASAVLAELGALTEIETRIDSLVLRGHDCLLSAAVHGRPEVCRALESLLAELVEAPVRECCERGERPRCCFVISPPDLSGDGTRVGAA